MDKGYTPSMPSRDTQTQGCTPSPFSAVLE